MQKRVLLIVLLVICFSSHLSAETLDCDRSRELGKVAAKEEYKAWGWYLLGIGAGIAEIQFSWSGEYSVAGATNVAGILLAWAFPLPGRIVPSSIDADLKCYRRGYKQSTTWRNYGAFVLGQLTPVLVVFTFFLVVYGGIPTGS